MSADVGVKSTTVNPLEGSDHARCEARSDSQRHLEMTDVTSHHGPLGNNQINALQRRAADLQKQLREIEILLGKDVGIQEGSFEHYFATSKTKLLKDRLPWLVMLLLIQSSAAIIMGSFEQLLDRHIVIAFFVPMIVGTGGNAGNQPGVMTTRALSIGKFSRAQLNRLLRREAVLGLCTGFVLAVLAFFRVLVQYPQKVPEASSIALAVFCMVQIAIAFGIGFSIAIDISGADPANGAAPLLTTIADLIGITLLCGISATIVNSSL